MSGNDLNDMVVNNQPTAADVADKAKTKDLEINCCHDNQSAKCACPKCGQRLQKTTVNSRVAYKCPSCNDVLIKCSQQENRYDLKPPVMRKN